MLREKLAQTIIGLVHLHLQSQGVESTIQNSYGGGVLIPDIVRTPTMSLGVMANGTIEVLDTENDRHEYFEHSELNQAMNIMKCGAFPTGKSGTQRQA